MLTVEQYISQMKKKDKLDEFDFSNHAENMTTIIKYVMDYFNNYLNPETYDYERIKTEQTTTKSAQEIGDKLPNSKDFIVDYYKKQKTRIDKLLKSWIKDLKYIHLFYCIADYEGTVEKFCAGAKMKGTGIEQYKDQLVKLAQEIKENEVERPSISGLKYMDNSLVTWIKQTYREYGVNLFQFAQNYTWPYYEEYVEAIYNRDTEEHYYINRYNHRYNNNPFEIEEVYKENSHRPFINGKKGELEMLLMYVWLFEDVKDPEYWPEYVNLCISTGRVNVIKNVNVLIPVKIKDIPYPSEIISDSSYVETLNGLLGTNPGSKYILRLAYNKDNDTIWKYEAELSSVIKNLDTTFSQYGTPHAIELQSPLRSQTYNEDEFFQHYRLFEKSMRKFTTMMIALVNGPHRNSSKPKYLLQSTEDIVRIRKIVKEMKFNLKFAIDFSILLKRTNYIREFENDFNKLSEIRNSIVGIHLSSIPRNSYSNMYYRDEKVYLNKFNYHQNSDFLNCISALFNDNLSRYLVPEKIESTSELEELVDDLLKSGFSFCNQEGEK
jgi:hypothetical protein